MDEKILLKNPEKFISIALDIGEQLLISGGEVARCEDTIERICTAYGFTTTHVFTVTAGIIVTAFCPDGNPYTQLRRIKSMKFNLTRLEMLNQLSRDICRDTPPIEDVKERLKEIAKCKVFPFWLNILTYAFISAAFSAFFSGGLVNMPAAAISGMVMCVMEKFFTDIKIDGMVTTCGCSFLTGLTNVALIKLGIGLDFASISIGNIMLLIPGIAMTNSIRDMFGGDFISGTSRLFQSMCIAFLVALGFTAAGTLV